MRRAAQWVAMPLAVLTACGPQDTPRTDAGPIDLPVSVRTGAIEAPDSADAGWTRLRVVEDGAGHIVVLFRLGEGTTDAQAAAVLVALDTAAATPDGAVALGGPEIGDVGEIILELAPGQYLLGCMRRGRDGHRHSSAGEAKRLTVHAAAADTAPRAESPVTTHEVPMVDFAYPGPERWRAGSHVLRVENRGRQDHQLRIARLREGSTIRDWMSAENPGTHVEQVAGVARLGPGMVAYLPAELPRGTYVLHCLVPDPPSGKPHVELGMFRQVVVE